MPYDLGRYVSPTPTSQGIASPQPLDVYKSYWRTVSWIHIALSAIGRSVARRFLKVVDDNGQEKPKHQLARLIERPNPYTTGSEFRRDDSIWRNLCGNSFWLLVPDKTPFHVIREIHHLMPDEARLIPDKNLRVTEYEFHFSGETKRIPAQWIIHRRMFSEQDDLWGASPIQAIRLDISITERAKIWNDGFFRKGGFPRTLMTPKEQQEQLLPSEMRKLRKAILQDAENNPSIPGIAPYPVDFARVGVTPTDIEWLSGQKWGREVIGSLFGVPPILMGQWESVAWANADAQWRAFGETTLANEVESLRDCYNEFLAPRFDNVSSSPVRVTINESALASFVESAANRVQRAHTAKLDGAISINEYREIIGLDPRSEPEADKLYVPLNMVPIESVGTGGPAPGGIGGQVGPNPEPDRETAFKRQWIKQLTREEQHFSAAIMRALDKWRMIVASRIEESPQDVDRVIPDIDGLANDMFNELEPEIITMIARAMRRELQRNQKATNEEIREEFENEGLDPAIVGGLVESPFVRDMLGTRLLTRLRNASEQVANAAREIMTEGLGEGLSTSIIMDRLSVELFSDPIRAERVARTETAGALNAGKEAAYQELGADSRRWVTIGGATESAGGDVRDTHRMQEDAEPTPLGQIFSFTQCRWPGDPAGPAEEAINCRCTTVPHFETPTTAASFSDGRAKRNGNGDLTVLSRNERKPLPRA